MTWNERSIILHLVVMNRSQQKLSRAEFYGRYPAFIDYKNTDIEVRLFDYFAREDTVKKMIWAIEEFDAAPLAAIVRGLDAILEEVLLKRMTGADLQRNHRVRQFCGALVCYVLSLHGYEPDRSSRTSITRSKYFRSTTKYRRKA